MKFLKHGEEWKYRRDERLAILCEGGEPNLEQIKMAEAEADEAIKVLNGVAE